QQQDAYMTYLIAAQQSLQALHDIKFVHASIIGQPRHYSVLITTMRTCLDHIEHIIHTHSPSPPRTIARPAPLSAQHTGDLKAPPPLPPKPSRMQKPILPPKPSEHRRPAHRPLTEFPDPVAIHIVAEGEVDPTYLVPAQTNAGDSLTPSHLAASDHVPLIPAPPLLTTHRNLQGQLDTLEQTLREYKARKQQHSTQRMSLETMTEDDLNQLILQCSRRVADIKQTLNRVRTLYMSAATIPTVMQFQAHIIAYQITLIESAIYTSIPPHALLEHTAKHPHPRIVASTDFFNYVTRFIEHAILLPQEVSSRAQHIHYWIKVASRCLDLNNYQTLKAIVSALGTPPVQRLRRTWAYIPKKSLVKLDSLNELLSEANNYGKYREHMGMVNVSVVHGKSISLIRAEHATRPTVPFLGTFIHDITYLLAAFKTHETNLPPEDEPRIHDVLLTMTQFQNGPRYTPVPSASYLKQSQKHYFRPALSNALQRGASGISRISGAGLFGFGSQASPPPERDEEEEGTLEEQQQMATQYILMRSWVAQSTVDELSALREQPVQKQGTPTTRSSSGVYPTGSVVSGASSVMRFSADSASLGTSTTGMSTNESRPTSAED
ncbi:ras guanine nucleotide exchange factor domain-containing protein, partial [Spinellus fusiger]